MPESREREIATIMTRCYRRKHNLTSLRKLIKPNLMKSNQTVRIHEFTNMKGAVADLVIIFDRFHAEID